MDALLPPRLVSIGMVLIGPPLLLGLIGKTKAFLTGRQGPPVLQPYHDLWKLLGKAAVYSRTTTWVFPAGPVVSLAAILAAAVFVPVAGRPAAVSFEGDLILWTYLLALARFVTVLAALDTGSSFEGMGASREVAFSALVEPALFLALAVVARSTGSLMLDGMFGPGLAHAWGVAGPALALVVASLFVVLLAENARLPVDDPEPDWQPQQALSRQSLCMLRWQLNCRLRPQFNVSKLVVYNHRQELL